MPNDKKQDIPLRINEEIDDMDQRLNELELQMVDAKEFSHLSSEAFESLQNQIAELREMFETLLSIASSPQQKSSAPVSEYI